MTDEDLPGDDLLDELEDDDFEAPEQSTPGEAKTSEESTADRIWGFLLSGIPLLFLGLITAVAAILIGWNIPLLAVGGGAFFLGLLIFAASSIPPGAVLWRRLLVKSLKNYRKATSADAIGFIFRPSGKVDPRAVKYLGADTDDAEGKWATASTGEKWGAGVEGSAVDLLGRTPVAFFDEEDPDRVTSKYGRMAEAVDLGQVRPLYSDVQIDEVIYEEAIFPPGTEPEETANGAAVADGGAQPEESRVVDREYRIRDAGGIEKVEDSIIDLSSPVGTSGGRISFEKAKELRDETATTEEMQRQEDRGRIAELKRGADRKFVLKVFLIAAAIIAMIYLGPMVIEAIFGGGGGGGGGGVVPFSIAPALGALGVI